MSNRPLLVLLCLAIGGCGGSEGVSGGERPSPGKLAERGKTSTEVTISKSGWMTDFSRRSVSLSEFSPGGPPRDGIPPLDEPKTVGRAAADAWLDAREPVLVVEIGEQVRAYPIQILVWHEVVNDTLGGRPVAVTYCPLCNSSLVFDRRVEGRVLRFGTTGNLRRSDLVMWDRQTESWWQQLTGEAIVGRLTGTQLRPLPSQTLSWEDFKSRYPEGDVLSRDTGHDRDYGANPYEGYDDPGSAPYLYNGETDSRLEPKERVVAFKAGPRPSVVPFSRLERRAVVELRVDGAPAVVLFKRGTVSALDAAAIARSRDVGTAGAFDRRVDGRALSFVPIDNGRFRDTRTGSTWDITGRAISGPLSGRRLRPVIHDQQFWFALAAFLPNARILG